MVLPLFAGMGYISIHALREEGDSFKRDFGLLTTIFLSTPSARRATVRFGRLLRICSISIHALREEGDGTPSCSTETVVHFYPRPPRGGRPSVVDGMIKAGHFYPRPPRGGRHIVTRVIAVGKKFLSTPSARRATFGACAQKTIRDISIHALREEGDRDQRTVETEAGNFYPRPPRGGRPAKPFADNDYDEFLSTPSARRATWTP